MLMIGGKTDQGHTIHLIVGPESDFYMDVHGTQVMDITPLLLAMNGTSVLLALTRCKSETQTAQQMTNSEIPHLNSFAKPVQPQGVVKDMSTGPDLDTIMCKTAPPVQLPQKPPKVPVKTAVAKSSKGRCNYCGTPDSVLMDIPNFKICKACIQIELGRKQEMSDKQVKDAADSIIGV